MAEQSTCGQGLAHHSKLPAKMAEVFDAIAVNLEAHLTAIDAADAQSQPEHDAYLRLARQHRTIAKELSAAASFMSACRALPMARHNPALMSSSATLDVFRNLVAREQELAELLQTTLREHQAMLSGRA